MKVWIKTLQGKSFHVEIENPSESTIKDVKFKIEELHGGPVTGTFPIAGQKLIHSGKVLKDDIVLTGDSDNSAKLTEESFLVCMVTKVKAPRQAAAAVEAVPAAASASSSTATPAAGAPTTASTTPATSSVTTTPALTTNTTTEAPTASPSTVEATNAMGETAVATTAATATAVAEAPSSDELNASVRQLCDMGFPEDQVRAALQAAFNNADRAVEYLMNGIPANLPTQAVVPSTTSTAPATTTAPTASSLEELRQHPQFDSLRRLVQSNPSSLPAVLQQIGAQSPHLLNIIHSNQEAFVRMLNEPIVAAAPTASTTPNTSAMTGLTGALPSSAGGNGNPSPQQIIQMLASLPPAQQQAMATQMGLSVEQFQQFNQLVSTMPPEALNQILASMGPDGMPEGMMQGMQGNGMGGPGGAPGGQPGQVGIQLTQEEAAAVERLTSLGFDRNEVLQAYIACEKNESLAANFLMDSMGDN